MTTKQVFSFSFKENRQTKIILIFLFIIYSFCLPRKLKANELYKNNSLNYEAVSLLPSNCDAYEGSIHFDDSNPLKEGFISQYLLTDENNIIIQVSNTTSFINVTAGNYLIYSINYQLLEQVIDNNPGNSINDIQVDCFDISEGLPISICPLPACDVNVALTTPIYNDNNTPSVNDDTFTFQATINGFGESGWIGGGLEGLYNQAVFYGPFPVDQDGANFIIKDKINNSCFVSISSNASSCIYTKTCTCCAQDEGNNN